MAINETSPFGLRNIPFSFARTVAYRPKWRRIAVIASLGATLAACNTTGKIVLSTPATTKVSSFVAADEATAAAVGRDLLDRGGSAVDAAAGIALAMSATLPSRAGLGGGGVCLVFDPKAKATRTLDFLPRGSGSIAAPLLVRGMYALQATGGKLRWEAVVSAAVRAAERAPVTRSLAAEIARSGGQLDGAARSVLAPGGAQPAEGAVLRQPSLAAFLGEVQRHGLQPIHGVKESEALGAAMGLDPVTIRQAVPVWRGVASVELGSAEIAFPELPEGGASKVLADAAKAAEDAGSRDAAARALAVVKAAAKGGSEAPAAGFVVVTASEESVACALTMGAPFGTGRMVPGTGFLAAVPVRGSGFGVPALQTIPGLGKTAFAAVATARGEDGPLAAPIALIEVAVPVLVGETTGAEAIRRRQPTSPGQVAMVSCLNDGWGGVRDCEPAVEVRSSGAVYTTLSTR